MSDSLIYTLIGIAILILCFVFAHSISAGFRFRELIMMMLGAETKKSTSNTNGEKFKKARNGKFKDYKQVGDSDDD